MVKENNMKTQKELKELLSKKVEEISLAQQEVSLAVAETLAIEWDTPAPDLYQAYERYVSALNALTKVGKKYDTAKGGKVVNQLLNQLNETDKKVYNMITKYFVPVD